jgi:hypothetical protein
VYLLSLLQHNARVINEIKWTKTELATLCNTLQRNSLTELGKRYFGLDLPWIWLDRCGL